MPTPVHARVNDDNNYPTSIAHVSRIASRPRDASHARRESPRPSLRARAPTPPLARIAMRIVRDRRAQRDAPIANARAIDRYSPRTLTPHWMFITVDIVVVSSCRVVSTTLTTPRDLDHETTSTCDRAGCGSRCRYSRTQNAHHVRFTRA